MTTTVPFEQPPEPRLESGFHFPLSEVSISAAEQQRLHAWCDIASEIFGDVADPSLVGRLPVVMISNAILSCRSHWGQVHTVQRIIQRRPIKLGESLTLHGVINGLDDHPRGQVLKTTWRYIDSDGETPFEVEPDALLIDPDPTPKPAVQKPKRQGAEQAYERLLTKRCTPEATVGYCEGTNNPIHFDLAVAQQFGFRAPILAGTQTMSFVLEPLYRAYAPKELSLTIGFRRPAYWDDVLAIEVKKSGAYLDHIKATNASGQCVTDCQVEVLRE